MGLFKKKNSAHTYQKETEIPVIHSSICTGEKVIGFKNIETGQFKEIMCLKTDADLQGFLKEYGIAREDIKTEY